MAKKKKIKKTEYEYHKGDQILEVARKLTGHTYLAFRLLEKNGLTLNDLKDGIILKWE